MTLSIIVLAVIMIGAAIVWINVESSRRRAAMTPEERLADDEAAKFEMQIW
jgi:hypothetical protein